MSTGNGQAGAPRLQTLGGQPAPPDVVAGWRAIEKLPAKVLAALPELVVSALTTREPAAINDQVEAFCKGHGVQPGSLAPLLDFAMQMVTRAAAGNLTREAFEADFASLSEDGGAAAKVVARAFEAAKPALRRQIAEASLVSHGRVLTGLEWRMDSVLASDRGLQLGIPLVNLTLRYRERDDEKSITLQAVPEVLTQLRQACQQLEAMIQQAMQPQAPKGDPPH